MEKIIGALPITNSDLQMMLGELIVQEGPYNRMGIKLLLEGIIKENPNACTWLTAFMIGRRIPNIPDVGSIGYLKLESLKYNIPWFSSFYRANFAVIDQSFCVSNIMV